MMTGDDVERVRAITVYEELDALGPDVLLVHAIHTDQAERRYLAQTHTPVSLSILSEMRVGMGLPPIVEMRQAACRCACRSTRWPPVTIPTCSPCSGSPSASLRAGDLNLATINVADG